MPCMTGSSHVLPRDVVLLSLNVKYKPRGCAELSYSGDEFVA